MLELESKLLYFILSIVWFNQQMKNKQLSREQIRGSKHTKILSQINE